MAATTSSVFAWPALRRPNDADSAMALTRQEFIAGAGAFAAWSAFPAARASCPAPLDPNLMVFFSDVHQHDGKAHWPDWPYTQANKVFPELVAEVMRLNPLPANAVVFGDFSTSFGWEEDFRLAAAALKPLTDAGVKLTLGMGNHDNRAAFMRVFPGYRSRCLVPGRIVSKVSTPNADLIMLDTLKAHSGKDWAEPTEAGNHVKGEIDATQRAWLRKTLSASTRPTFVGAHHRAQEVGIVPELVAAPTVYGYIFGHEHISADGFLHDGYANSRTVQTATLPSGGFWGDIGYALFRTFADRAELTFRQTGFWFNRPWPEKPRPKNWRERVRMHNGRKVTFWYDKPGDFYKG